MAATKKRRGATGASSESLTRKQQPKDTPYISYPEHLPRSMRRAWRELAKAAEAWIDADGAVMLKVSYVGADDDCHLAGMVGRRTARLESIMNILRDEGLQIDRSERKPGSGAQA